MNLVDSSCWLEYFAGSPVGEAVAPAIEDPENLLVPTVVLYEVFKKLSTELDEDRALFAIAHMKQGVVVDLDSDLAVYAASLGKEFKLALADSIVYATARKYDSILWTQDKHFQGLSSVKYFPK